LRGYKEEDVEAIQTTWRERRVPEIADACFSRLRLPNPEFPLRGGGGGNGDNDDDLT
jgi:hypothetical protein